MFDTFRYKVLTYLNNELLGTWYIICRIGSLDISNVRYIKRFDILSFRKFRYIELFIHSILSNAFSLSPLASSYFLC